MPPRRGRPSRRGFAARKSVTPLTPKPEEQDDDEMLDRPDESQNATPAPDDDDVDDDAGTNAADSDMPDEPSNPPTPQTSQSLPPKRRPGRPPRPQPADWGTPEVGGDEGSETGTPVKRRRGRPSSGGGWRGGFRGRARAGGARGSAHATRPPTDKEGNTMDVVNDEVVLPDDPEGETKVDKNGYLQADRDYRVRVFTIKGRGKRLYMLSTEPARCTGFRDSYLFFTKHMSLYKIIIDDEEKRDLIERDLIPHSYKGRAIGVVTARSVFREFGARIVINGKKVTDDYHEQAARDRGDVEGELADPNDRLPPAGQPYNKNQYVAWHGASSVYHTNAPAVPVPVGRPPALGKTRKSNLTTANWMLEHARNASNFNSMLRAARGTTNDGVYDPHTNLMYYPANTQPTFAKWERLPASDVSIGAASGATVNGVSNSTHTGITSEQTDAETDATPAHEPPPSTTLFQPVSSLVSRNYIVVDTLLQSASQTGITTQDPKLHLGPISGALPDLSEEDLAELPEECRIAFMETKRAEAEWRSQWGNEQVSGLRGRLRIGVGGI